MAISDKLLQLNQIKQDIKEAIENKGVDLTDVDFGGYAEKIDLLPAVVELTQAQYDELSPSETWLINETLDLMTIDIQINFTAGVLEPSDFTQLGRLYIQRLAINTLVYTEAITQNYITCYNNYSWVYPDYRTITFETAPTGELLTWLEANAVKQKGSGAGYDDNTYYLIVEA